MSEWFKEHAWKACIGESLSRVRIPLSPPIKKPAPAGFFIGAREGSKSSLRFDKLAQRVWTPQAPRRGEHAPKCRRIYPSRKALENPHQRVFLLAQERVARAVPFLTPKRMRLRCASSRVDAWVFYRRGRAGSYGLKAIFSRFGCHHSTAWRRSSAAHQHAAGPLNGPRRSILF